MADPLDASGGNRRMYAVVGVVLVVIAAAGAYVVMGPGALPSPGQQQPQDGGENQTDPFEEYASATEETGTTNVEGATVGATVEILQYGTSPSRVEISTGEAVRWVNTNSFPVELSFDRTSQTPRIPPGGNLTMRFRGITEYTINNTQTGQVHSRGEIYVQ